LGSRATPAGLLKVHAYVLACEGSGRPFGSIALDIWSIHHRRAAKIWRFRWIKFSDHTGVMVAQPLK
jgi:hypothetical protein